MNLHEEIVKFGLTSKEAKIYLTLLEQGSMIVKDIAKQAKLNRSTTYVLLESLIQKGLVSVSDESMIKLYNAVAPERLVLLLENNAKKYLELVGVAQNIMPELKALYTGVGPKPRIMFYEGVEGLRTAYESTLESTETIKAYASVENMHNVLEDYFPGYYHKRANKKIKIQAIFPDTEASKVRMKYNKEELREAYLVPNEEYGFSPEIMIYDNKIAFLSLLEKFALTIESRELANAMKQIFKLSFSAAKRFKK